MKSCFADYLYCANRRKPLAVIDLGVITWDIIEKKKSRCVFITESLQSSVQILVMLEIILKYLVQ